MTNEPTATHPTRRATDAWTPQDEARYQAEHAQYAEHVTALREGRPERLMIDGVAVDTSTWFIC